jgi:DNA topoisomerase-2
MVLVNGSKGIGTGFSTNILCYNPLDIILYLKNKILKITNNIQFVPYYDGFQGEISQVNENHFIVKGKYEIVGIDKIRITELPVGFWTNDFKEYLEELSDGVDSKTGKKIIPIVKDYDDMSKDTTIDFTVTLQKGKLEELGDEGIYKQFKLISSMTTTNMHLFDAEDKLKKYSSIVEIIDDYFLKRLEMYSIRKQYLINHVEKELLLLKNKVMYIQENLDGTIDLRKKSREEINKMLSDKKYELINDDYKYLTKMPMDCVTEENVVKIENEYKTKNDEVIVLINTTPEEMWLSELKVLEEEYILFKEEKERMFDSSKVLLKKKSKKVKKVLDF